jgi:hypothetical protein
MISPIEPVPYLPPAWLVNHSAWSPSVVAGPAVIPDGASMPVPVQVLTWPPGVVAAASAPAARPRIRIGKPASTAVRQAKRRCLI